MQMKHISYYKKDINRTHSVMKKTFEDALNKRTGNVTLRALPPVDLSKNKNINLMDYNFEVLNDIDRFVDDTLLNHFNLFEARKDIDDNFIPSLDVYLGIGDFAAFVGGEIEFKEDTSWCVRQLEKLSDFDKLPPLGTAKWYQRYLYIIEQMLIKTQGTDIPLSRGFFSPMDLAEALRSSDIYFDIYDDEAGVHALLDYCDEALIKFAKDIIALLKRYDRINEYSYYLSDTRINMSEDIACLMSPDIYNKYCAPHTQKVIDAFGEGNMHCHSRAQYLVNEICSLKNICSLWYVTDPNAPVPIENLDIIIPASKCTTLAIDAENFEIVKQNAEKLMQGNFSIAIPCNTMEDSYKMIEEFNTIFGGK